MPAVKHGCTNLLVGADVNHTVWDDFPESKEWLIFFFFFDGGGLSTLSGLFKVKTYFVFSWKEESLVPYTKIY